MKRSEHSEQVALFNWAKMNEHLHPELKLLFAIPNGGHRHKGTARKLKAEGVKSGVPDVFLPIPTIRSNKVTDKFGVMGIHHGLWIEMKYGRNKATKNQSWWLEALEKQGYKTAVCYGFEEAKETILDYLKVK